MTRIYNPDTLGKYGYFLAIITVISPILSLRFEQAIVLARSNSEGHVVKDFCLFILVITTVSIFAIIFIVENTILNLDINIFIIIGFLLCITNGLLNITTLYFNSRKEYKSISSQIIAGSVSNSTLNILLGLINPITYSLAFSLITSKCISLIYIFRKIKNLFNFKFQKRKFLYVFKKYNDMAKYSTPESLFGGIGVQMNIFIIGIYDIKYAGMYFLINRVLGMPISIISGSFSRVFFEKFTKIEHEGRSGLLIKCWSSLALLASPVLLVMLIDNNFWMFLLGDNWTNLSELLVIMLPFYYLNFICSSTSTSHLTLRLQHIALIFTIISVLTKSVIFYYGFSNDTNLLTVLKMIVLYDIIQVIAMNAIAYRKTVI